MKPTCGKVLFDGLFIQLPLLIVLCKGLELPSIVSLGKVRRTVSTVNDDVCSALVDAVVDVSLNIVADATAPIVETN